MGQAPAMNSASVQSGLVGLVGLSWSESRIFGWSEAGEKSNGPVKLSPHEGGKVSGGLLRKPLFASNGLKLNSKCVEDVAEGVVDELGHPFARAGGVVLNWSILDEPALDGLVRDTETPADFARRLA